MMKLVNVIPISKGIGKEMLTYFTAKDITPGSIVTVPVRKKETNAIVVSVEDASISKSDLRSKNYTLKKVGNIKVKNFFLPEFIEASKKTAEYFVSNTGAVINALTPKAIQDFDPSFAPKKNNFYKTEKTFRNTKETKQEILLTQSSDEERFSLYKSVIREEFAKNSSVFFCIPEISEADKVVEILKKGINEHVFILHSKLTKKEIIDNWKKIINHKHPVLVVASWQYLGIPRKDITTIILERESSDSYKILSRPYIDIRKFAEFFADFGKKRLIFGDIFLRTETIYKRDDNIYAELSTLKFRSISESESFIIDMKDQKGGENVTEKSTYNIISAELKQLIETLPKYNEKMFILTARRGLYPITLCNDCGDVVACEYCNTPLVLHKDNTARLHICHKCGFEQKARDSCKSCGSWRMQTLGVGIENAEEEIRKNCKNVNIFRIDADSTKTVKKIKELRDLFYKTPGSVLLGTKLALPHMGDKIKNVAVLSLDSLFTIPDFNINERVFNILLRLRALSSERFLIQTRDTKNNIFIYAAKGNLLDFYRDEIILREKLFYPPFSTLIKITREGEKNTIIKDMEKLTVILEEYKPNVFPAFVDTIKGKYRMNMLLKIKRDNWPNEKLLHLLQALPKFFSIDVEPKDIL